MSWLAAGEVAACGLCEWLGARFGTLAGRRESEVAAAAPSCPTLLGRGSSGAGVLVGQVLGGLLPFSRIESRCVRSRGKHPESAPSPPLCFSRSCKRAAGLRARGKTHTQALLRLARQRINVLFAMLRDGTFYEPRLPEAAVA